MIFRSPVIPNSEARAASRFQHGVSGFLENPSLNIRQIVPESVLPDNPSVELELS